MASRLQAAVTRLRRFEEEGPPQQAPREQHVKMRLGGGRTGKRAVICENLTLTGLTGSFGAEIWFDDRVAVLGSNGSGKSSFLRLLAGEPVPHEGVARLGARVVPGFFAQTHARPDLAGRAPVEILTTEHALLINEAMAALARYALADADNAWWSVSAWQERGLMEAFVRGEPHLDITSRLDHYCDEATFVDWEQDSPDLPDWQTSWRHLVADGMVAELTHPSAANQTRAFPAPVQAPPA